MNWDYRCRIRRHSAVSTEPKFPGYAEIAFPIPLRKNFTYSIPDILAGRILPGCRVYAPLGKRNALGYVVCLKDRPPEDVAEIKSICQLVEEQPLFDQELMKLLLWVADYYLCSLGEAMAAAYPFSPKMKPRQIHAIECSPQLRLAKEIPLEIRSEKQRKVLESLLSHKTPVSLQEFISQLEISASVVKSLERKGLVIVRRIEEAREPQFEVLSESPQDFNLTGEQETVLSEILIALSQGKRETFLLHGVTGSGKTEVYLRAIAAALERGKSALVLIPEIALTPQTMGRFRARLGDQVGILHSGLGQGERFDEWQRARRGERRVVVGTRSAVFAPVQNLGLVIVDEEHESSYKQHDPSPRYSGRDVAVYRAWMSGGVAILGSATPSVESFYNARCGKYHVLSMPRRVAERPLPTVHVIDMRGRMQSEQILSSELQCALQERRERNEQTILFLNRRGFATSMACRNCGYVVSCSRCSVALVYHKSMGQLLCHHCDYRQSPPNRCPSCHENFIQQQGFGTERVVQAVAECLPGVRVARLDQDVTRGKSRHESVLTPFRVGKVDILVGTQMVAKGLDFPGVTLVGMINADYALSLPDFRAGERTFCLLTQVAGRSGRGDVPGEVFVQTCCPDNYAVALALKQDYLAFYEKEIRFRRVLTMPPITRLVLWRIEARVESQARGVAWDLYRMVEALVRKAKGVSLFPPVEAPLYRLRDHYRWQVAMKATDYRAFRPILESDDIQKLLATRREGLRVVQDVDPLDML
ncbi:MAG TPA: primosomal protein N' [bacterium]|nr:primosomal protein N' [bacterium]